MAKRLNVRAERKICGWCALCSTNNNNKIQQQQQQKHENNASEANAYV